MDHRQANPTAPVKMLLVSLTGEAIPLGLGTIARLTFEGGAHRRRLRLTEVRVAE